MILPFLVFALACFLFGSFGWATMAFFRMTGEGGRRARRFLRFIGRPLVLVELACIWFFQGPTFWVWSGLTCFSVSAILFWWTVYTHRARPPNFAFSDETPNHLVRTGPYRLVRHPFYSAYSLTWLGGTLVTAQWWLLAIFLAMGGVYLREARREERCFLEGPLGDEYRQYRAETGMFLPAVIKLLRRLWSRGIKR